MNVRCSRCGSSMRESLLKNGRRTIYECVSPFCSPTKRINVQLRSRLRGQLGARGFVTWVVSVIILAAMMPTLMGQINLTLPSFNSSSPEYFLWSIMPFVFVIGLGAALITSFLPQAPGNYQ